VGRCGVNEALHGALDKFRIGPSVWRTGFGRSRARV